MKLLFLFFLLPLVSIAQLIDNRDCAAFTDEPFFSKEFIKDNKIKRIYGSVSTKKDLQVIEKKGNFSAYNFNEKGELIKQYSTSLINGKSDTLYIDYLYDSAGNLCTQRTSDSYGFFSYNYSFDEEGKKVEKTYCRDENCGIDRYHFKLKKQYVIVKEGYSYEKKDSVVIRNVLNNHGRAYMKEIYSYDGLGLLAKIEKQLVVNKKLSLITYRYNDLGLVAEKIIMPDKNQPKFTKFTYDYDQFGNLEYIDEYRNETKITHKEIIYNKSNYLMSALLIQDVETNFIKIIKYNYLFFD